MLAAEAGSVEPGTLAESVVLVRNTGEEPDEFNVTIQGPAAAWAAIDPHVLRLGPDEEGAAWVRFQPPRNPSTVPGPVSFSVVVASKNDLAFTAIEPGHIDVGSFARLQARLDPEPRPEGVWQIFTLEVDNGGNRPLALSLSADDSKGVFVFDYDADPVTVLPGQATTAFVRVRAAGRLLPANAEDRRFTITILADGLEVQTVEGGLDQPTGLRKELRRSAIALAAALVFLALLALLMRTNGAGNGSNGGTVQATRVPGGSPTTGSDGQVTASEAPSETVPGGASTAEVSGPPADLPRLVFIRTYDGGTKRDIVVRAGGSGGPELRLRSDDAVESRPALSPDATRVAYIRDKGSQTSVCVIAASGGDAACIADASPGGAVAWRGDQELVFSRNSELFSVSVDGGSPEPLSVRVAKGAFVLTTDGTRIAYPNGNEIAIRPLDGSSGLNLKVPGEPDDLVWSPDGDQIAFSQNFQIFITPAGNGAVHQLTANDTVNSEPAWSRDGHWVVFRSNRTGNGDLYAVRPAAGIEPGIARVTSAAERDGTPSF